MRVFLHRVFIWWLCKIRVFAGDDPRFDSVLQLPFAVHWGKVLQLSIPFRWFVAIDRQIGGQIIGQCYTNVRINLLISLILHSFIFESEIIQVRVKKKVFCQVEVDLLLIIYSSHRWVEKISEALDLIPISLESFQNFGKMAEYVCLHESVDRRLGAVEREKSSDGHVSAGYCDVIGSRTGGWMDR